MAAPLTDTDPAADRRSPMGSDLNRGRWPPFRGQLADAHGEFRAVHSGRCGQWTRHLRADSQRQTSENSVQALQLCQSVAERAQVGGLLEMPTNGAVLGDCTWLECRTIRGRSLRGLDQFCHVRALDVFRTFRSMPSPGPVLWPGSTSMVRVRSGVNGAIGRCREIIRRCRSDRGGGGGSD